MIFEYLYKKRYCNYTALVQRYNEKIEKDFILSTCNWNKNTKYFLIKINKKIKQFIKEGGVILSYYDKNFYKKIKQFKKLNFDNFIIVHNRPEEL